MIWWYNNEDNGDGLTQALASSSPNPIHPNPHPHPYAPGLRSPGSSAASNRGRPPLSGPDQGQRRPPRLPPAFQQQSGQRKKGRATGGKARLPKFQREKRNPPKAFPASPLPRAGTPPPPTPARLSNNFETSRPFGARGVGMGGSLSPHPEPRKQPPRPIAPHPPHPNPGFLGRRWLTPLPALPLGAAPLLLLRFPPPPPPPPGQAAAAASKLGPPTSPAPTRQPQLEKMLPCNSSLSPGGSRSAFFPAPGDVRRTDRSARVSRGSRWGPWGSPLFANREERSQRRPHPRFEE
ncbi:basic proline-rich protein-like [Vombatus ursinus]|uniref:basic proline-rich protein-like n=1 Tax=Vombatus ursinus TaxID=29139 RepID=UPI000FFD4018|nr:basic proline-rich protein-like [Vombatus ursinus]